MDKRTKSYRRIKGSTSTALCALGAMLAAVTRGDFGWAVYHADRLDNAVDLGWGELSKVAP